MNLVAASFAWPFRGEWRSKWLIGLVMVVLLPIAFIPLLGYAVAATRAAAVNPAAGLPPWALSRRLLADGFWVAVAITLVAAPFAIALGPLSSLIDNAPPWRVSDPNLSRLYSELVAIVILALPWGLVMLLLMPHSASRFALSGRPGDLLNVPSTLRSVGHDFATWNLAAAAIVTAWALGIACVGLLCIGVVPGIFYAILVSAHATAALHNAPAARV